MNKHENGQTSLTDSRPEFLTVEELAQMLRIKTRTVYEMVSQERIPYRKAGRRVVFLLSEILEWTDPHTKRAHSRT